MLLAAVDLPAGVRAVLLVVAALLLVGLGALLALAITLRKTPRSPAPTTARPAQRSAVRAPPPPRPRERAVVSVGRASGGTGMTELLPVAVVSEVEMELTGVIGKICPRCRERYDLAFKLCKADGAELASLN